MQVMCGPKGQEVASWPQRMWGLVLLAAVVAGGCCVKCRCCDVSGVQGMQELTWPVAALQEHLLPDSRHQHVAARHVVEHVLVAGVYAAGLLDCQLLHVLLCWQLLQRSRRSAFRTAHTPAPFHQCPDEP